MTPGNQGPRFKVYDRVWMMSSNRPQEFLVFAVVESMGYYKRGTELYYHLVTDTVGTGWGNNEGVRVPEGRVFPTKEALLESL